MEQGSTLIRYRHKPSVIGFGAVVGKKEHDGPLGDYFDLYSSDDRFGKNTWEQAESEMQRLLFQLLLQKTGLQETGIGGIFAGDLQNQCAASGYGLKSYDIPYFGLYGACSTMAESLLLASAMVEGGFLDKAAAVSSSHFCSAERQFRSPIEYGGQRTPTSQWTVTGAGGVILGKEGPGPYISAVLPGRVVDKEIKDANNMGAAMAPAFIDTLTRFFQESGTSPTDFDLILSGDLGQVGYDIVMDLMGTQGYDLRNVYQDCGMMIYDSQTQDVHAGGSGCGCSASVLCGYVLHQMRRGMFGRVLLLCTGALLSTSSVLQGLSIPGIAHLICFTSQRIGGGI